MNLAAITDDHPGTDVALVCGDTEITYGDLRSRAGGVRGALRDAGLVEGDRVAILGGNEPQTVVALLGALGAGMVAVPLNPQSPRPEIEGELATVGATTVLLGPSSRHDDLPGALRVDDLVDHEPVPITDRDPGDLALLMFTSGTAGAAKAAMLTQGNLAANLHQLGEVPPLERRSGDVTLGLLPLFHVFGLNAVLVRGLATGGTVVLVEAADPAGLAELIAARRITTIAGPPTLWSALASLPPAAGERDAFASVRLAASGAAALPVEVARAVLDRFGLRIHEGYGLTETSPVVATSAGTEAPLGSVGRPLPGVEVRLVDSDGDDVLVGDVGEIHVRGPNVFVGYWDDPEATALVLTDDGWLRTGDLGVVDDDGHLFVVDRLKDIVIVSGFNVLPAEVEEVLAAHPAVADVAVVGEPHERTGEAVVAHVVVKEGREPVDALADELAAFVGERLARYKCPSRVEFVDEIPRGLGGKVLRRGL